MNKALSLKSIFIQADLSDQDRLNAFERIYRDHQASVRKTVFWMAGASELDDLVQEVFIKVWKSFERFKGESQMKTWIYRITVNTVYDSYKKNKRKHVSFEDSVFDHSQDHSSSQVELQDLVYQAVLGLKLKWKDVFVLFYKEELTVEEIAEVLKVSTGTVKSRLHYAREAFKEYVQRNGGK